MPAPLIAAAAVTAAFLSTLVVEMWREIGNYYWDEELQAWVLYGGGTPIIDVNKGLSWINRPDVILPPGRILEHQTPGWAAERGNRVSEEIKRVLRNNETEIGKMWEVAIGRVAPIDYFLTKERIELFLYGRQMFRCNLVCANPYWQPYTDCNICDKIVEPELEDVEKDRAREEHEDWEKEQTEREDPKQEEANIEDLLNVWRQTEKKIATGRGTAVYTGRGFTDNYEQWAKWKSNRYLNFMSVMRWGGARAKMAKGWYQGEFRFWAEILVGGKWLIFDLESKFKLKDHLQMNLQKKLRKKYLKTSELLLNKNSMATWLQQEESN